VIVDSRAYCFEGAETRAGHKDVATHLRYLQWSYAVHHQRAWRVRYRAPASVSVLLDPAPDDPYRLPRHRIERYCDFLTSPDMKDIMGRTAARVLAR
jgi:hypothetical protein